MKGYVNRRYYHLWNKNSTKELFLYTEGKNKNYRAAIKDKRLMYFF